jgi:predicted ATPase
VPRTPSGHPELLDRERELADVASGLESATAGSGRILVVEGPSGIGKTELLRRAVELARQTGFTALSATAAEVERDVPYGVVRQLFERSIAKAPAEERSDLFSGAAALATVVLEAGTSTTEAGRDGTPDPVRGSQAPGNRPAGPADLATVDRSFRVDHGLYWLCANMTARAPVLLAVDDGHWVDAESTRFLLYLARRIEELPIFFLASVRPEEEGSRPLDELASLPVATVVRPRPLSEGGVARVTRAALGDRADDVFCSACHAATGGNPFLLHAVLRALAEKGVEPFAAAAATVANVSATAVSRWMVARIERLSPQAPALARAAAVLGPDALLRQAAALAFLDERQAAEVTDQLVAAGILRAGRPLDFEHPVVRAAVYDAMPSAERGDAHKRAARVLALEGASPHRVAAHLLACEPSGDRWTVEILRSAATHALERGAPESATRYLRRALDEPPAQSDRADVLKELGAAELRVDAAMAAEHLRMALGVSEEPVQRALICLPLLDAFAWAGRVEEMLDPVSATIDAVHDRDPDLALELEAKLVVRL